LDEARRIIEQYANDLQEEIIAKGRWVIADAERALLVPPSHNDADDGVALCDLLDQIAEARRAVGGLSAA
jgi:hypothetical protein